METLLQVILLLFLVLTGLAIILMRDLFAVAMLVGIYGLLSASFFVVMDAVDVAFTEAAVGVGISTLLLISTLSLTGRYEKASRHNTWLTVLIVVLTGILLIYGTLEMPAIGSLAPAHQHLAQHYLEQTMTEIGIPNVVTAVLASYRGYDTLGELLVIFTAGIGVMSLLQAPGNTNPGSAKPGNAKKNNQTDIPAPMHQHKVLRIVTKMLLPFILLFALYVQFHGEYGPGGGFQAGVIFAAGIILFTMIFGLQRAQQLAPPIFLQWCSALGILLYGATGVTSMLSGGNFLDYNWLVQNPVLGQQLGIILVELGVGITVAAIMILIFFAYTGRLKVQDGGP